MSFSARCVPGLLGAAALLAAWAVLKAAFGVLICDDAYITLGHARSWASGLGAVMSERNPVSATSTPLFTALLALESLAFRTADYERLAYATNVAADLIGLFLVHRIASRGLGIPGPWALGAAAAYALSINFLAVSAYGMEAPLYTALGLAAAWFRLFSPRPLPGLIPVCLLSACIRPEGGLIAGMAVLAGWIKDGRDGAASKVRWRRALACSAAAAFGLALFFLFYHQAYGHWLPHSVTAKRLEIRVGLGEALWSWLANVFYKGPTLGGAAVTTAGNLLFLGAALAGFLRRMPPSPEDRPGGIKPFPWALLAWPAAYVLFYLATRSSYILFTWYYLPVLPFILIAVAYGLARLAAGRLGAVTPWAMLMLFMAFVVVQTHRHGLPEKHRFLKAAREDRYRAAAEILNAMPGRAPLAMIDEVGALAYFAKVRILDSHGLLSPEALPYLRPDPEGYWDRLADMRQALDPDWILGLREVHMEGKFHAGEDRLYRGYRPVHILRLPPHGWNMEMWAKPAAGDSTRFAAPAAGGPAGTYAAAACRAGAGRTGRP